MARAGGSVPLVVAIAVALAGCSGPQLAPARAGQQQVQVVTPLPTVAAAGTAYPYYRPRSDLTVAGEPATETFGAAAPVALPDGSLYVLQDTFVSVPGDDGEPDRNGDEGAALVRIDADGTAALVDSPYADRERGRDIAIMCAAADGTLYAMQSGADEYRLVSRTAGGGWRPVTASIAGTGIGSTGDGGPAAEARLGLIASCGVAPDGSVYLAESCLVRRIDPAGVITVVAGRRAAGSDPAGCGTVDSDNRSDPPSVPVPTYAGPAGDAELGEVSALTVAEDGTVWLSALRGLQRITPDGQIASVTIPDELVGPYQIRDLTTLPDGTLFAAYGVFGPTGIAVRDPATDEWDILLDEDVSLNGVSAPAPMSGVGAYGARIAASPGRLYISVSTATNAGVMVVPWP